MRSHNSEYCHFEEPFDRLRINSAETSCPSFWASDKYYGPAALVTAHRFVFDSRDEGASERLHILSETNGTVRCHTAYNCTNACPRDIHITRAIGELKMAMVTGNLE